MCVFNLYDTTDELKLRAAVKPQRVLMRRSRLLSPDPPEHDADIKT